jgi:hypothetical protein
MTSKHKCRDAISKGVMKLECGESGAYVWKQFHIIEPSVRTTKRSQLTFAYIYIYTCYRDRLPFFIHFFIFLMGWDWVHLVLRPLFGLLYQHRMIGDDCGPVDGMRIGRGNRSTRRKPAPVPLCPPQQVPHYLTWARSWAAAVGSRRLTAWAVVRPPIPLT